MGLIPPLSLIDSFIHEFVADGRDVRMKIISSEIGPPRSTIYFSHFDRAFRYFHTSPIYEFAILTIGEETYGISKCIRSGRIGFHDTHGRDMNGRKGGNLTALIFFSTLEQFFTFLLNEHDSTAAVFSLDYVTFEPVVNVNTVTSNSIARVISGSFAQNDERFGRSANTQCTANSVVFLAFTFVLQNDWTTDDIDAILVLGDFIYDESYRKAITVNPREHTFLAAHEIRQNIYVNINRLNRGIVHVQCKPLSDREYSGNFGRFCVTYMQRFFRYFTYGVFICCKLSVALYKFNNGYVVFDPHARSGANGLPASRGTANIFFFNSVEGIFEYFCNLGYNKLNEFTLTPFHLSELEKNRNNLGQKVVPPLRRPGPIVEIGEDSMDDIPLAESQSWDDGDDVPLAQLHLGEDSTEWGASDDIPLIRFARNIYKYSQVSSATSVRSMPVRTNRLSGMTKSDRYNSRKRNSRRKEKEKQRITLATQEEQLLSRRWTNYLKKLRYTGTENVFGSFENYKEFFLAHKDDGSDDEIVQAADAAVEEFMLAEQTRQLRLLKNAMNPTHFLAFGNHEEIDESDEKYRLYKLSPMDQKCPHCEALYFKEECNSKNVFRTCCNFGEIHSDLPQRLSETYPALLKDLLLRQTPLSHEFMTNIMFYNNVLSFASLGTTNIHHMQARGSLGPVMAIEGMIYHVAEHFHTNSTGENMPTAQLYYIESNAAVTERLLRAGITLNRGLLLQLEVFLRANNPFAGIYKMLKDVLDEVRRRPNATNSNVHLEIVRKRDQIRIRQNHGGDFGVPTSNEVAVVYTHQPATDTKNIVIFPRDQTPEQGIHLESHDPNRDALLYPILFPHGEQTWSYRPGSHVDVDKFVSAEIPDRQKNARLYEYVTKYMYHHRCDDPKNRETCMVPRKGTVSCPRHPGLGQQEHPDRKRPCICYECSKKFPKKFASKSELVEGSYPIYRRRCNGRKFLSSKGQEIDNRWIVPYNPYLLLRYNCHMNVEITSSLKSIKYLFKYLHKGLDMARLNIKVVDNVQVYNEFDHFVDCRYLSAGEAIWKIFDSPLFFQMHTVYALPVHLENYQNVIFNPENPAAGLAHGDSMLTAYFELNRSDPSARQYFYCEIPLHYVFDKKTKKWKRRQRRLLKTLARLYIVNYN